MKIPQHVPYTINNDLLGNIENTDQSVSMPVVIKFVPGPSLRIRLSKLSIDAQGALSGITGSEWMDLDWQRLNAKDAARRLLIKTQGYALKFACQAL